MAYGKDYGYDDGYNNRYPETQVDVDVGGESEKKPSWNWCTHVCSVFTWLCCFWCAGFSGCCGLFALICSISSYTDYKSGDYDGYKYKKCCAIAWIITSLLLGLGTLAAGGYFTYFYHQRILDYFNELQSSLVV